MIIHAYQTTDQAPLRRTAMRYQTLAIVGVSSPYAELVSTDASGAFTFTVPSGLTFRVELPWGRSPLYSPSDVFTDKPEATAMIVR